ncbi:CIC11C00000003207 [Sungouiella intermedia]|uniref:CIC11C00000003207 n=1 Tax=Sungouiella intermedia TaxID=45354 RepID=A0A1L0BS27_9ASCO|nr:CIC11C00000003207 [[Candida] intermedia]
MRLLLLLPFVAGLNVLMTSTDSWVSMNARYLYRALVEDGHNVVFIGPQTQMAESGPVEAKDGGDFNHLLPAHQKYYRYVRKLKTLTKGAKGVILKKDIEEFDKEFESQAIVSSRSMGQDPLNKDFWYVNANPLDSLAVGLSEIIPKYLPDFHPDLVLVGPNEGLHLSSSTHASEKDILEEDLSSLDNEVEAMVHLAQVHNYPTIAVSTEDVSHIYYQNEDYFNVEEKELSNSFKNNHVTRNLRFVSRKIVQLVNTVGPLLNSRISLNINFPSMSPDTSTCLTSLSEPAFEQVISTKGATGALGKVIGFPTYEVSEEEIVTSGFSYYKMSDELQKSDEMSTVELMRMLYLIEEVEQDLKTNDAGAQLTNKHEHEVLTRCKIAVSVNHISKGNNMDESVLDLSAL